MIVYLPIFMPSVSGKTFSAHCVNPGCGGTEFVTIMLAYELARARPDWQVRIVNDETIGLRDLPENLNQRVESSPVAFFEKLNQDDIETSAASSAVIATATILGGIPQALLQQHAARTIAWIHHPFDYRPALRAARLAAYVCVGSYQWYSNKPYYRPIWYIQNLFELPPEPIVPVANDNAAGPRLVHLGALVEAKGFLHIAREWQALKQCFPDVSLDVIGSSATYGDVPTHPLIPTDEAFAREILALIPAADIKAGKVQFHGNLGEAKFPVIASCDVAIQNPTGDTEAFPASPLECMAMGVPVIASADFGMEDAMRYFPELIVETPQDIVPRLERLMANDNLLAELKQRSRKVAARFDAAVADVVPQWVELLQCVGEGRARKLRNRPPPQSVYGSRLRLWCRSLRRRLALALGRE